MQKSQPIGIGKDHRHPLTVRPSSLDLWHSDENQLNTIAMSPPCDFSLVYRLQRLIALKKYSTCPYPNPLV